jgi:hypothetical protein
MTLLGQIIRIFASRMLAIYLLVIVSGILAFITILEARETDPPTPFPLYQSWPFFSLLALLSLSMVFVYARRQYFRARNWAGISAHYGLVLVLLGGLISHMGGTDGYVSLEEKQATSEYMGRTPVLVLESDNLRRRVDLGAAEDLTGVVATGPQGREFEIVEHKPSTSISGHDHGRMTPLMVKVSDPEGGEPLWLRAEGPVVEIGPVRARLTALRPLGFTLTLLDATEIRWPASNTPRAYYSTIRVDDPDEGVSREWMVETNDPFCYRGFRFYQDSMGTGGVSSGFHVSRDPGLLWVTIGIVMFGLGLTVVFVQRFIRDPLASRGRENPEEPPPLPETGGAG